MPVANSTICSLKYKGHRISYTNLFTAVTNETRPLVSLSYAVVAQKGGRVSGDEGDGGGEARAWVLEERLALCILRLLITVGDGVEVWLGLCPLGGAEMRSGLSLTTV